MESDELEQGTLKAFHGNWGSGIAELEFHDHAPVLCENNSYCVGAFDSAFPGFISEGHCIDNRVIDGRKITFSVDCIGILEGFSLVDDE